MLIDDFSDGWLDELNERARAAPEGHHLYLLIDGAFVPGIHRRIAPDRKAVLFESLPGCSDDARDASPFLTPFIPDDAALVRTLRRCGGWPMLSLLETPEGLRQLSARLAAWCVIEADGQRFNFRFADTRRLPGILDTLDARQRGELVGPAVAWTHIARDGTWREIAIARSNEGIASEPILTDPQFTALVDDSHVDTVLLLLSLRGCVMDELPSRRYLRTAVAISTATAAKLSDDEVLDWCEWQWTHARTLSESNVSALFDEYMAMHTPA